MKDRNLFHLVNTIDNIFTRGCATREYITDGVHSMKYISIFHRKKNLLYLSHVALVALGWSHLKRNRAQICTMIWITDN